MTFLHYLISAHRVNHPSTDIYIGTLYPYFLVAVHFMTIREGYNIQGRLESGGYGIGVYFCLFHMIHEFYDDTMVFTSVVISFL